ncbi:hypothetical protein J2I47_04765 [Fibrella sp. HMF5335]|uniref:Uncharacterized protein n=1 Tax=Fibrella rubiginis TaxID=2817060 RepID=A0A939GG32_9BACT|nr:hypothetical protein [Fibrella rubiginis]MBO0935852.1 hypothetical protein [Fibrella rubiginis]
MKTSSATRLPAVLFAVMILLTAAGFRPDAPATDVPPKVATSLSAYFSKLFQPLKSTQIETMKAPAFTSWLQQSSLSAARKNAVLTFVAPVLTAGNVEIIHVKKAKALQGMAVSDVVLIRVPGSLIAQLNGSGYVTVFDSGSGGATDQIETCQYVSCYCSSTTSPGSCVTATQFNKNCPPNECPVAGGTCDCGSGGGGTGLVNAFETLFG